MAWSPEDEVSPEQKEAVMNEFESLAFAGMEHDQRSILWVEHGHSDHTEIHFVVPRTELTTGKAMNPFPPGWHKDFNLLRDK